MAAFTIDGTALTDDRAYDPFGAPVVAGDPNLRIGYQGSWTDPDTGLVNAQARWYNPATATFLSRDTADLPWTGAPADNRYTYAAANPVTYTDPTGFRVSPDAEMRQSVAEANRKYGRTDMKCNAIGQCAPGKAPAIVRGKP
ncbi:RHS repeat-associated core domain-containing protein, partial [Frankia sp. CNm7]